MGCGCCKDEVVVTRQEVLPPPRRAPPQPARGSHVKCDICSANIDASLFDGHRETCRSNHRAAMRKKEPSPALTPTAAADPPPISLDDELLCIICLDRRKEYAIVPCGHVIGCYECAMHVDCCPVCRQKREGLLHMAMESSRPKVCKHCKHLVGPTFYDAHAEVCALRTRQRKEAGAEESVPLLAELSKMCAHCSGGEQDVALIPCGHMSCGKCAEKMKVCSICLTDIKRTMKTYS